MSRHFNGRAAGSARHSVSLRGRYLSRPLVVLLIMGMAVPQLFAFGIASAAEGSPTVTTGKADYFANELVDMYGSGFAAETTYTVVVVRPDGSAVIYAPSVDGLHGEELCYDADASDGTACSQSVTSDTNGSWTNYYQLDGVSGTYTTNVYDEGGSLVSTSTFEDAASLAFVGTDGVPHTTAAGEENLGTFPFPADIELSCLAGNALQFRGANFGTSEVIGWDTHYFAGALPVSDNAILGPISTLSPSTGSISGAAPSDCINLTIETGSLTPGGTYHGLLETTTTEAGDKTRAFKYFFRFSLTSPPGEDLIVTKTAATQFKRTFTWDIDKDVDKTFVQATGGDVTFNYTVAVSHDGGVDSDWLVGGSITVANPNWFDVSGVDVTDAVDNGGTCTVADGQDVSIAANDSLTLSYTCTYASAPTGPGINTATAAWPAAGTFEAGSDTGTASFVFDNPDNIDNCATVTDTWNGTTTTLGTVCITDPNPTTFNYSRTVAVPVGTCVEKTNTARFTTSKTGATGSASKTVTVCGPDETGAGTIGWWRNKNGQALILGTGPSSGTCRITPFLRTYLPFQDLSSTSNCKAVAAYVTKIIDAASSSGTSMNPMLKAQMLGTALNVYYSSNALGGNKLGAPAPIGGLVIDLNNICVMTNTSTCTGQVRDVGLAFGGADSLTVGQLLTYASSRSNSGGKTWYSQIKSTQELAKDTFDAINNEVAFVL